MKLKNLNITDACTDGAEYFNSFATLQDFILNCDRGDWLLWLFAKTNPNDIRLLTLAKGHCANTVRHLMQDVRATQAVDAAIAFGEGNLTLQELSNAADTASAYTASAYAANAANAAYAAYAAAAAAASAANADTYAAASAANAAAASAANAAAYTTRIKNRQLTADICRKYLSIKAWKFD